MGRLCIFDSLKFLNGVDGAADVGGGGHFEQALFVVGGNVERFNEGLDGCLVDAVVSAGEFFEFLIRFLDAVFAHDGLDWLGQDFPGVVEIGGKDRLVELEFTKPFQRRAVGNQTIAKTNAHIAEYG